MIYSSYTSGFFGVRFFCMSSVAALLLGNFEQYKNLLHFCCEMHSSEMHSSELKDANKCVNILSYAISLRGLSLQDMISLF